MKNNTLLSAGLLRSQYRDLHKQSLHHMTRADKLEAVAQICREAGEYGTACDLRLEAIQHRLTAVRLRHEGLYHDDHATIIERMEGYGRS